MLCYLKNYYLGIFLQCRLISINHNVYMSQLSCDTSLTVAVKSGMAQSVIVNTVNEL